MTKRSGPAALPSRAARKLRRRLTRERNRVARRRALLRLRDDGDPLARRVADVLAATAGGETTPDERAWIERIERLRADLRASSAPIDTRLSEYTGDEAHEDVIRPNTLADLVRAKAQPPLWALLLLRLVREFRPATCLELGTGTGISAAYQAAALRLNGRGRLVTIEAAATRVDLARRNFDGLGLGDIDVRLGRFQDVLDDVLRELGEIDFALIDGHHAEQATIDYFHDVAAHLAETSVLVFDDIDWSEGMARAWKAIAADERTTLALDLGRVGLWVHGSSPRRAAHAIPLE